MTSKFSAFMAQNVARIENKKIVVSNRFKDPETGKPMEWEIRALTNEENDDLQRRAMVNIPVGRLPVSWITLSIRLCC